MPSFDVVSEVDLHELSNAVDQANREVNNRFDFKGSNAKYALEGNTITLTAPSDFQVKQMFEILENKMIKRQVDIKCMEAKDIEVALHEAKQTINVKQGIEKEAAKKIVKLIKDTKLKVQAAIQGEQIRVTAKKRDELQEVISMLRDAKLDTPLQYNNFRD